MSKIKFELDEFDLQAEREGQAIKNSFQKIGPLGKKCGAQRRAQTNAERLVNNRLFNKHVKGSV